MDNNKVIKQIELELHQIEKLIETHKLLIKKCKNEVPGVVEISALAAFLHSYYTGIENIFKRIIVEFNESLKKDGYWHKELIDIMTVPTKKRPAVISKEIREEIVKYLEFRHFFSPGIYL
ncbi:MAG: hypothetical protein AB1765_06650 [Candidatus Hydrogenedentota bacterium]